MRFSVPEKLIKMLWEDDNFFRATCKNGNISINRFPKNDQWVDKNGFNISFALAGYSSEDVVVEVTETTLTLSSKGIVDIRPERPEIKETDDAMSEYVRVAKPVIQQGVISRGIARRSFNVSYHISSDYNCYEARVNMVHGLLHVIIPLKKKLGRKILNVTENK